MRKIQYLKKNENNEPNIFLKYLKTNLKTASLDKWKRSFSLLWPPATTQVGIPDDGVLVESRVKVKDDV